MKKQYVLPCVAILFGILGCLLRFWELGSVFEADTGLPIQGAPASLALVGLCMAAAVVLALLSWGRYAKNADCDQLFCAQENTLFLTLIVLAAFSMAAAGVLNLLSTAQAYQSLVMQAAATQSQVRASNLIPRLVVGVGALASGGGLLTFGKERFRSQGSCLYTLALLLPAFTACALLITVYQSRSGDPILLDYVYELLAGAACTLGTYFLSGLCFKNQRPYLAVVTSMVAIVFCLTTLADRHDLYVTVLLLAFVCYFCAMVVLLLTNIQPAPQPRHLLNREEPTHEG